MAITRNPPFTIHLGGHGTLVNDVPAGGAITPGMLIERYNASGTPKFRAHNSSGGFATPIFALNQSEMNKGIDDAYAADDLVKAFVGWPGSVIYAIVPSGQNIAAGAFLESNGDGRLKVYGSGVRIAQAVEACDNSAGPGDKRIKVETF